MIPLIWFTYLSIIIFVFGIVDILVKRDGINLIIGVELIVNAALINFVSGSSYFSSNNGAVYALFVLVIAVFETVIMLALLLTYFRRKDSLDLSKMKSLRG